VRTKHLQDAMRAWARRARASGAAAGLLVTLVLAPSAFASDLARLRVDALERGLPAIRGQVHQAPGRAAFELQGERQRLRSLRVERSRDARVQRLARELQRLEWQADRLERRDRRAAQRVPGAERLPVPGWLRPPYDTDLRGDQVPIGAGRLYILLQNGLRDAEAALAGGRPRAAALDLARAESRLQALKARFPGHIVRNDPNVVAAEGHLAALRAALAAAGEG
jgi:hypothetical protein